MHRGLTICLIGVFGCCGAIVVPTRNGQINSEHVHLRDDSNQRTFTSSRIDDREQTAYSTLARETRVAAGQFLYPIYPDYGNKGHDGSLVPTTLSQTTDSSSIIEIAMALLPFSHEILVYGTRVGARLLQFVFVTFLGGILITIICTFTSVCTIESLGLSLTRNQVKEQVAELARIYVTTEAVDAATLFISKAFDKYAAMQNEKHDSTKGEEMKKPSEDSSSR